MTASGRTAHASQSLSWVCSVKQLGVFLFSLFVMQVHCRLTTSIELVGQVPIYRHRWQEYNAMAQPVLTPGPLSLQSSLLGHLPVTSLFTQETGLQLQPTPVRSHSGLKIAKTHSPHCFLNNIDNKLVKIHRQSALIAFSFFKEKE